MAAVGAFLYNRAGHNPARKKSVFDDGGNKLTRPWNRSFSAGEIMNMRRTPNRRYVDSAQPSHDLLSPRSSEEAVYLSSQDSSSDPMGRSQTMHFSVRNVASRADTTSFDRRDRSLDYWMLGEGMRIKNFMEPTKYRAISQWGENFQGKYNTDWNTGRCEAVKAVRSKTWYGKRSLQQSLGPYPQDLVAEELIRNRSFAGSHGSPRAICGMLSCGKQCFIP
eukprot:TRINITY_DN73417_c0_g1_i1.p1 TRINITY_DN73417_c0_g1~~TRINITY_DN73417_c0_g1_i1.p1  ORF type:complete len:221 (-),score=20.37 TRINITY_DN73417_c0_g1_i1:51-713(-)